MEAGAKAGIALLGVAALVTGGALVLNQKPPELTCELSAGGLGLVGSTVKQGKSAAVLAAGSGGLIVANEACKNFLKKLDEDPEEKQPVKVTTGTGTVQDTISRRDLTAPPPPLPPRPSTTDAERRARFQQVIDCFQTYENAVLRQWCYDGKIRPTAN